MSDRRPENPRLYLDAKEVFASPHSVDREWQTIGLAIEATPADLLAAVRRGVESGTIEGKRRRYCEAHDSIAVSPGYRCDHYRHLRATGNEGSPCQMIETLVIPVDGGES